MRLRRVSFLLLFLFACLCSSAAFAQVETGRVTGLVLDQQGAVVPGASVLMRNVETGIARTLSTDAEGRYRASQGALLEVTDAQTLHTDAQTNHIRSLYDYKIAEAQLIKAMGSPQP